MTSHSDHPVPTGRVGGLWTNLGCGREDILTQTQDVTRDESDCIGLLLNESFYMGLAECCSLDTFTESFVMRFQTQMNRGDYTIQ